MQSQHLQHSLVKISLNYSTNPKNSYFLKCNDNLLFYFATINSDLFTKLINLKSCNRSGFDSEYLHL